MYVNAVVYPADILKDMALSTVLRKRQQAQTVGYYDARTATKAFAVDDIDAVIRAPLPSAVQARVAHLPRQSSAHKNC